MKRSTLTAVLAFVLGISTATQASACLCIPYIPFLDPFAWLGFYGCGGGYGGCGYAGGGGYGYGGYPVAAPQYRYGYGGYAPQQQAYPIAAAAAGCSTCTGALPAPQQQMTAVQIPVTTYRRVTQYIPQTTYQTQYRAVPTASVAYQPQYQQAYGYQPAQTAYAAPAIGGITNATAAYNGAVAAPSPSYTTPYYAAPTFQPPSMSSPAGDIAGDHEWRAQSAQVPVIPNSHVGAVPTRSLNYGVRPRSARSFSATVR